MSELVDVFRIAVPAVIVPLGVFSANWIYRQNKGYAQSAASDFILAVLIFDGSVVATAKEFEAFVRSPELQLIVVYWHMTIAIIGALLWAGILKWGEPVVAKYYEITPRNRPRFPAVTFILCWMGVFLLVSAHVMFFVIHGEVQHG